jgi:hypothetical protein
MAFSALQIALQGQLLLSVKYEESRNIYQLQYIRTQSDLKSESPCAVGFQDEVSGSGEFSAAALLRIVGCSTIYILLPDFMGYSKAADFMVHLPESTAGHHVVFVGYGLSDGVVELLGKLPGSTFLSLPQGPDTYFWLD